MTKNTDLTPMHLLFNRLRERIKETKIEIAELKVKLQQMEKVEAALVEKHSDPMLEFVVNFWAKEFTLVIEGAEQGPCVGPTEAVRQIFAPPDTQLTAAEVRDLLEDMRQEGQIETKVKLFDSDKTNKILRELVKQKFLLKQVTKEGNRVISVYARR